MRKSSQARKAKEMAPGRESVTLEREIGGRGRKQGQELVDRSTLHPWGRALPETGLSAGQILMAPD